MILSENLEKYFVGDLAIADSNPYFVPSYISQKEISYLQFCFGTRFFLELKADLQNGMPASQKWTDFVFGKIYDTEKTTVNYVGIERMLECFIFAEVYKISNTQQGQYENVELDYKNSKRSERTNNENEFFIRYNEGVDLFKSSVLFLRDNNEKIEGTATGIVDEGDGTYNVIADTLHVGINTWINFGSQKYKVLSVGDNVFTIQVGTVGQTIPFDFTFLKYGNFNLGWLDKKYQYNFY